MQNRYVGDIGDFGKIGLLRFLLKNKIKRLKIGINWYLTSDETHNNDGKHIAYLLDGKKNHFLYRECDNALYDELHKIVKPERIDNKTVKANGERCVKKLKRLPWSDKVTFFNIFIEGETNREAWFEKSMGELSECSLLFLDPDNGLEVESCPK